MVSSSKSSGVYWYLTVCHDSLRQHPPASLWSHTICGRPHCYRLVISLQLDLPISVNLVANYKQNSRLIGSVVMQGKRRSNATSARKRSHAVTIWSTIRDSIQARRHGGVTSVEKLSLERNIWQITHELIQVRRTWHGDVQIPALVAT